MDCSSKCWKCGTKLDRHSQAVFKNCPLPWEFDFFPKELPKYSTALIYAADSERICEVKGENSKALAEFIVNSVNKTNWK